MARIRGKDTGPEMTVRRAAHRLGYRFRLYRRDLPGAPDLVFPSRRAVIFVHGCFWHQHAGCRRSNIPKSRPDYWLPKLARNEARDRAAVEKLQCLGWRVAVVWECEAADPARLGEVLFAFLGPAQ